MSIVSHNTPKCAVLLAAYNGLNWIDEQINSVLLQANVDITIFISVDISTDGTFQHLKSRYEFEDKIVILSYSERFGGAGKNFYRLIKDVDFSGFDFIALSDQDDIWLFDKLATAISNLEINDCYSSNVTAFWSDGRKEIIVKSQPQLDYDFLFEAAGPGCTYVFKTEVMTQFKSLLVNNYRNISQNIILHDWLIYAFARSRGFKWFIDHNSLMMYRQHENNQVGTNNNISAAKKRLILIKEKWYRKQSTLISEYLGLDKFDVVKFGLKKGYIGNLYLLLRVMKLRRRLRDRIALSVVLLLNLF